MARSPKLKVFRTPTGFHDAYVAAPSRKAALAAWGAERDLFARGVAEEVTDPALMAEPLASPGAVVKRSRGSAAEQLAALPERVARARPTAVVEEDAPVRKPARRERASPPTPPPPPPRPDRDALDEAEAALAAAEKRAAAVARDFNAREAALARERRAAEREVRDEATRLERERDRERRAYDRAVADWRGR